MRWPSLLFSGYVQGGSSRLDFWRRQRSTYPSVIWHCRRRQAFRTFFFPEKDGGGRDNIRGSTPFTFNKRSPPPNASPRTEGAEPSQRAGQPAVRRCEVKGLRKKIPPLLFRGMPKYPMLFLTGRKILPTLGPNPPPPLPLNLLLSLPSLTEIDSTIINSNRG